MGKANLLPEEFNTLVSYFSKFPGVGEKSARRFVFFLLTQSDEFLQNMGSIISNLKKKLKRCDICGALSDQNPCRICSSKERDHSIICVVETNEDLISIEESGVYNGIYHVLGGVVSPADGIYPEDLAIDDLIKRVKKGDIKEVIIATSPHVEGDLTADEIIRRLEPYPVKISRIAFGLPVGGSIVFADKVTLHTALESRIVIRG